MEAFARTCPDGPDAAHARRFAGEVVFRSWRRLPRGFSPEFCERQLALWRRLAPGPSPALGGGIFQAVARVLGPERAGRLLRRVQARPYANSRTMSDGEFEQLLRALPPA
jgi:hypothetical protein